MSGGRASGPDERAGVRWRRVPLVGAGDDAPVRSLAVVIGLLAFLAAAAAGAAAIAASSAAAWAEALAGEATVVVRPEPGRDLEADVGFALALARAEPGIAAARALSRQEAAALLEPWIGRDVDPADLPAPRLVVLTVARDGRFDVAAFGTRLAAVAPGATADDGSAVTARLAAFARSAAWVAAAALGLVFAATGLAVAAATRGVMAGRREAIDVLHLVGASDRLIAAEVARRFAFLGAIGGVAGSAAAAALLAGAAAAFGGEAGDAGSGPGLLDGVAFGSRAAAAVAAVAALAPAVAALASWISARRTLRRTG